jgi:hypothetical protein
MAPGSRSTPPTSAEPPASAPGLHGELQRDWRQPAPGAAQPAGTARAPISLTVLTDSCDDPSLTDPTRIGYCAYVALRRVTGANLVGVNPSEDGTYTHPYNTVRRV